MRLHGSIVPLMSYSTGSMLSHCCLLCVALILTGPRTFPLASGWQLALIQNCAAHVPLCLAGGLCQRGHGLLPLAPWAE